jgi:FkbM family methyltransferase
MSVIAFLKDISKKLLPPIVVDAIRKAKNTPSKAQLEPQWLTVENGQLKGCSLYLNTFVGAWPLRMLRGEWEVETMKAIESRVKPGWTCFDVGGHIGYLTLFMATLTGDAGKIYTFEPLPHNVERIQRHVERNRKDAIVNVYPIALSNSDGTTVLHGSDLLPESCGAHLSGVRTPPSGESLYKRFSDFIVVQRRIDDLIERNEVQTPNLIKIDVEGAEAEVLKGAMRTLQKVKPVLIVELHNTANAVECMNLLLKLGYRVELLEYNGETALILAD